MLGGAFVEGFEFDAFKCPDRELGEDGGAVAAAVVVNVVAEVDFHVHQLGELGRLVDVAGAVGFLVDFLKGDDIGLFGHYHFGNAGEVELVVGAFAMVDVVGDDAEFGGEGGLSCGGK